MSAGLTLRTSDRQRAALGGDRRKTLGRSLAPAHRSAGKPCVDSAGDPLTNIRAIGRDYARAWMEGEEFLLAQPSSSGCHRPDRPDGPTEDDDYCTRRWHGEQVKDGHDRGENRDSGCASFRSFGTASTSVRARRGSSPWSDRPGSLRGEHPAGQLHRERVERLADAVLRIGGWKQAHMRLID